MNSNSSNSLRAFNIKCPDSFKTFIQEKFGNCFSPLSQLSEEIVCLDRSYTIYRFSDCFCVFHSNKPTLSVLSQAVQAA